MRTVTVKGLGNISAKPDCVNIEMTIESIEKDYAEAMDNASRRIRMLQRAAMTNGFTEEDLKTLKFNVNTMYESRKDSQGNYKKEFVGYCCLYRLKLSFDFDSKQLVNILSSITDCGALPELSISFTVKDPTRINEELLICATENARQTAEILCKASGNRLGQLINIKYNRTDPDIFSSTEYELNDCMPQMAMNRRCIPEITPNDINISKSAEFTWLIE